MSLAEKADPYAVGFCLNGIFFLNSVHRNSFLSSLKTKNFAPLETPPVFTVPTPLPWGLELPSAQVLYSQRKLLSPQTHKTRPSNVRPRHACLGVWGWIQWTVKSFWSLTPKSLISHTWEENPVQADPRVWTWLTAAPHICSLCSGAIWHFNGHFYWESEENRRQWASMLFSASSLQACPITQDLAFPEQTISSALIPRCSGGLIKMPECGCICNFGRLITIVVRRLSQWDPLNLPRWQYKWSFKISEGMPTFLFL